MPNVVFSSHLSGTYNSVVAPNANSQEISEPYRGFPTHSAIGPTHHVWLIYKTANTVPTMNTNEAANPEGSFVGSCSAEVSYAYPRREIICSMNMMVKSGVKLSAKTFRKLPIRGEMVSSGNSCDYEDYSAEE